VAFGGEEKEVERYDKKGCRKSLKKIKIKKKLIFVTS
jgi:hypothetical protein